MAFAGGSAAKLSYIEETTYGTTPASPTMTVVPFTSFTADVQRESIESAAIRESRQVDSPRSGNSSISGDLSVEHQNNTYDALLASLFGADWATNVLKVGNDKRGLSFEQSFTDITQYRLFRGMLCNTLNMNIAPNQMTSMQFGLMGLGTTLSQSATAASENSVSNRPSTSFDGVFNEGGSQSNILTGLTLSIDNGFAPQFVLGTRDSVDTVSSSFKVSGTLSAFFEDEAILEKFLNETETSLQFAFTDDAGNTQTWLLPKIKYTGGQVPVNGPEALVIDLPFVAYYDTTTATTIQITRVVA